MSDINNININWFSYIYNQLLPIIIGVADLYKIAFPNNIIEEDNELVNDLKFVYKFIYNDIDDRKKQYPKMLPMINRYNIMINISKHELQNSVD